MRQATVKRQTTETDVEISINLDGVGKCESSTGVSFLDHMLSHLAVHGLFDLYVKGGGHKDSRWHPILRLWLDHALNVQRVSPGEQ